MVQNGSGGVMVEDSRPARTARGAVWGRALLVVAAALVAGLALVFHYFGWTSIPGNACGGRYSPCPDGTAPTILLAFLCTFVGLGLVGWRVARLTELRPGKALPAVLVVTGAVLALWPGWQAYAWMRGPVVDRAWVAPVDRPGSVKGVGDWVLDGAVVRARSDGLTSYGLADGRERWSLDAPVRGSACAMSDTVTDGVGVIAFGREDAPCDTVWGIDTASGRKLWERRIKADATFGRPTDGRLAVDSGIAVALEDTAVRGYALRAGDPRWTLDLGEGCAPVVASAAAGRTRMVVQCMDDAGSAFRSLQLVSLDSATGKHVRRTALPAESHWETAMVVSARPFSLWLKEKDDRGTDAVLSFDEQDRLRGSVKVSGRQEDLSLIPYPEQGFDARPALRAAVVGDVLVTAAMKPGEVDPGAVSGYALDGGRRLWHTGANGPVTALTRLPENRLAVLAGGRIHTLDPRTGHLAEGPLIREGADDVAVAAQLVRGPDDGWVLVNPEGTGVTPPLLGFGN
ncbi:PQQ-like beta-propeller repeat protein [Streptomyces kunmingensis]|uniref:PQQ-like beta-propeller repeat protein n=1 Tax=Streptomyces kunmingensis TaxID=68225 RepID=A0ABU6C7L0_9ACTN|nr:PQQ-binding-like beta-propeller repeat protein [Streptomyces kunmingensis]MEB3960697.1 PQQ-like beta-propeller repeat protein [Streptomyces kunmingensis]